MSQWDAVRSRVKTNQCQPCFVSKVQERQHELGITDAEGSSMAGSLFGAGSDTTASGLAIFVMAMCKFPAVLRELQDEIDGVCGGDRCMPTFADLTPEQTPYLHAVVQETLRWRPISAGGFQHKLTQDVEYRGFLLPKGSSVVAPHWSISLDEKEYPDPHVFRPERFLQARRGRAQGQGYLVCCPARVGGIRVRKTYLSRTSYRHALAHHQSGCYGLVLRYRPSLGSTRPRR